MWWTMLYMVTIQSQPRWIT